MMMPASTNTQIAACVQIQNGDIPAHASIACVSDLPEQPADDRAASVVHTPEAEHEQAAYSVAPDTHQLYEFAEALAAGLLEAQEQLHALQDAIERLQARVAAAESRNGRS